MNFKKELKQKDDIILRLEAIERSVRRFEEFIRIYYERIPIKYRKAFPENGENPLFTHAKFLPLYPKVTNLDYHVGATEIQLPQNPQEYTKAKERMESYEKLACIAEGEKIMKAMAEGKDLPI
jgi:hypothetical protein